MTKQLRNKTLFLLAGLVLLGESFAQEGLMNYNSFISNVESEHPLAIRANNYQGMGEAVRQSAKGGFDPELNANYNNKFFSGTDYYSYLSGELKQSIYTAQSIKAGYEYGQGVYIDPEHATPTSGLFYIGAEASVLQGLMMDKKRAEVLKSRYYREMYGHEKNMYLNDLLYNACADYTDWLLYKQNFEVLSYFSQIAFDRYQALRTATIVGERPATDTIEAMLFYQSRNSESTSANTEFYKASANLNSYLWSDGKNKALNYSLRSSDSLSNLVALAKPKVLATMNLLASTNPLLGYTQTKIQVLRVDRRFKQEFLKPKLDVKYNFLTIGGNSLLSQLSTNNYKWGLSFSYPLLIRSARGDLKMTSLQYNNARLELDAKTAELNNKLKAALDVFNLNLELLGISERNVLYSTQLLEAEKLKFAHGESSVFMVNTRESKVLESQLKLLDVQAKLLKSYFYLHYLSGDLNYKL